MNIRSIISILLIAGMYCCCVSPKNKNSAAIRAISILDSLPGLPNATREEDIEKIQVYFYKNYRLYRIRDYKGYYYFARVDTANEVYIFKSLADPAFRKLPADSLYKLNSDYREPILNEERIVNNKQKTGTYTSGNLVTEVYTALPGRAEDDADSVVFVYSTDRSWDSIPYIFSNPTMADKNRKLVKYRFVSNGVPGSMKWELPWMISSEIIIVHPSNEEELLNAFSAFEKFLGK